MLMADAFEFKPDVLTTDKRWNALIRIASFIPNHTTQYDARKH